MRDKKIATIFADRIICRFKYDAYTIKRIKKQSGAKYNPETREWSLDNSDSNKRVLETILDFQLIESVDDIPTSKKDHVYRERCECCGNWAPFPGICEECGKFNNGD
jgi:hypothetical protein